MWRAYVLGAIICLLAGCVSAVTTTQTSGRFIVDLDRQPDTVIHLWPDGAPGVEHVDFSEEIIERDNKFGLRDRAAINVTDPTLSVFRASRPNGQSILLIPGGGYARVVIDKEGYEGARYFSQRGFDVFVLKYRLPHPDWPLGSDTSLHDAQRAMHLVRAHSAPDGSVAVIGFSAGGHLAGSLAQRYHQDLKRLGQLRSDAASIRPDRAILVYPVALMSGPFAHEGSVTRLIGTSGGSQVGAKFDLTKTPNPNGPPVMLVHTIEDSSVPVENSIQLAQSYQRTSTLASLHLFTKGQHGFGFRGIDGRPVGAWPILVEEWLLAAVPNMAKD